ncbi:ras-domain-containing protein [Agrocybe pediades]|nr:ras-domain-containing protein [Agrocybe pediades]
MEYWSIAMVGEGGVGKTALGVQVRSIKTYDPTIEDSYRKQLVVGNKLTLIEVIDTAGQEEYRVLRDQWLRLAQGFLLVYSVTSRRSFSQITQLVEDIKTLGRVPNPTFILIGNKCDSDVAEREVSYEEGAALALHLGGCVFLETTAKTGVNVDKAFISLIHSLRASSTSSISSSSSDPTPPMSLEKSKHKGLRKKWSECILM